MTEKQSLQDVSNEILISSLVTRHEVYARTQDPQFLIGSLEYRAELLRRLEAAQEARP